MLNFLSIPLPLCSDDNSGTDASDNTAEVVTDSPHQHDESLNAVPGPESSSEVPDKPTDQASSAPD